METPGQSESEKKTLEEQQLEFKRAQLAVEFAKFGFAGTLTGAICGMVMILALAIIDAISSDFTFGATGVITVTVLIAACVLGFGAFSLWQPVKILARFGKMSLRVRSDSDMPTNDPQAAK